MWEKFQVTVNNKETAYCLTINVDHTSLFGLFEVENKPPVADAGEDQTVIQGELVTLDGSSSYDENEDALFFNWQIISKPETSNSILNDANSVSPTIIPDLEGEYIISLVVNDGKLSSEPDAVSVVAISYQDAIIQLLQEAIDTINNMDLAVFKNRNMQKTLINKINAVIDKVIGEDYEGACNKLQNDILGKMDGCATKELPDKNDWIIDCDSQDEIYPIIISAIELICEDALQKSSIVINNIDQDNNLNNIEEFDNLLIYPNPTTNEIIIQNISKNIVGIELFNLRGELLLAKEYRENQNQIKISLSHFFSAYYILKVKMSDEIKYFKIIKE